MPLDLEIIDKEGNSHPTDVNTIMGQLQNAGYSPKATTPDGMNIIMTDDQGDYTMPINEVLQNVGVKLAGVKPQGADESGINALWRYGVESLPEDDDVRKAFITSKLSKEAGVQNPQVQGKGSDWYYFNPEQRKWMALTSGEGMTTATLAGLAPTALKAIGAAIGGTSAAIAGGGIASAATGAAGAVLGGRGGHYLNKLISSGLDPDIGRLESEYADKKHGKGALNHLVGDLGENKLDMALDGVTGGFAGAVPKLFAKGAISQATRGAGSALKTAGNVTQGAANVVDNQIGRAIIRSPVTGGLELGAFAAQAPGYIATKGTELINRGAKWLGNKTGGDATTKAMTASKPQGSWGRIGEAARQKVSEWGGKTAQFTDDLMQPRGPSDEIVSAAEKAAENVAKVNKPKPKVEMIGAEEVRPKASARDIMGNLGEKIGFKINPKAFLKEGQAYINPKGATDDVASVLAAQKRAQNSMAGGKTGEAVGKTLDDFRRAGKGIEDGLDYATKKALGGVRNTGKLASATGRGMQTLGTLTNPWENRLLARQGLDQVSKKPKDYEPEELRAFFKKTNAKKLYGGQ